MSNSESNSEKLVKAIWERFPTVRRTRPQWAAAIGFFFGGIGLAIYFRSFVDFIAPLAIAIVASLAVVTLVGAGTELGWLAGAIIASLYGLSRSHDSNRRLDEEGQTAPIVPASPATS
jgi:hypothetical protein